MMEVDPLETVAMDAGWDLADAAAVEWEQEAAAEWAMVPAAAAFAEERIR